MNKEQQIPEDQQAAKAAIKHIKEQEHDNMARNYIYLSYYFLVLLVLNPDPNWLKTIIIEADTFLIDC